MQTIPEKRKAQAHDKMHQILQIFLLHGIKNNTAFNNMFGVYSYI